MELERGRSTFPRTHTQIAANEGRPIFYDEANLAAPEVQSVLNNLLEYRFFTATSGQVIAAKDGFSVALAGNKKAQGFSVNAFRAAFASRIRFHYVRSPSEKSVHDLLSEQMKVLKKPYLPVSENGDDQIWTDIDADQIRSLAKTYSLLLKAYQDDKLPVGPSFRPFKRLLISLCTSQTAALDAEDELLRESFMKQYGEKFDKNLLWPLRVARIKGGLKHYAKGQDFDPNIGDSLAQALSDILLTQMLSSEEIKAAGLEPLLAKVGNHVEGRLAIENTQLARLLDEIKKDPKKFKTAALAAAQMEKILGGAWTKGALEIALANRQFEPAIKKILPEEPKPVQVPRGADDGTHQLIAQILHALTLGDAATLNRLSETVKQRLKAAAAQNPNSFRRAICTFVFPTLGLSPTTAIFDQLTPASDFTIEDWKDPIVHRVKFPPLLISRPKAKRPSYRTIQTLTENVIRLENGRFVATVWCTEKGGHHLISFRLNDKDQPIDVRAFGLPRDPGPNSANKRYEYRFDEFVAAGTSLASDLAQWDSPAIVRYRANEVIVQDNEWPGQRTIIKIDDNGLIEGSRTIHFPPAGHPILKQLDPQHLGLGIAALPNGDLLMQVNEAWKCSLIRAAIDDTGLITNIAPIGELKTGQSEFRIKVQDGFVLTPEGTIVFFGTEVSSSGRRDLLSVKFDPLTNTLAQVETVAASSSEIGQLGVTTDFDDYWSHTINLLPEGIALGLRVKTKDGISKNQGLFFKLDPLTGKLNDVELMGFPLPANKPKSEFLSTTIGSIPGGKRFMLLGEKFVILEPRRARLKPASKTESKISESSTLPQFTVEDWKNPVVRSVDFPRIAVSPPGAKRVTAKITEILGKPIPLQNGRIVISVALKNRPGRHLISFRLNNDNKPTDIQTFGFARFDGDGNTIYDFGDFKADGSNLDLDSGGWSSPRVLPYGPNGILIFEHGGVFADMELDKNGRITRCQTILFRSRTQSHPLLSGDYSFPIDPIALPDGDLITVIKNGDKQDIVRLIMDKDHFISGIVHIRSIPGDGCELVGDQLVLTPDGMVVFFGKEGDAVGLYSAKIDLSANTMTPVKRIAEDDKEIGQSGITAKLSCFVDSHGAISALPEGILLNVMSTTKNDAHPTMRGLIFELDPQTGTLKDVVVGMGGHLWTDEALSRSRSGTCALPGSRRLVRHTNSLLLLASPPLPMEPVIREGESIPGVGIVTKMWDQPVLIEEDGSAVLSVLVNNPTETGLNWKLVRVRKDPATGVLSGQSLLSSGSTMPIKNMPHTQVLEFASGPVKGQPGEILILCATDQGTKQLVSITQSSSQQNGVDVQGIDSFLGPNVESISQGRTANQYIAHFEFHSIAEEIEDHRKTNRYPLQRGLQITADKSQFTVQSWAIPIVYRDSLFVSVKALDNNVHHLTITFDPQSKNFSYAEIPPVSTVLRGVLSETIVGVSDDGQIIFQVDTSQSNQFVAATLEGKTLVNLRELASMNRTYGPWAFNPACHGQSTLPLIVTHRGGAEIYTLFTIPLHPQQERVRGLSLVSEASKNLLKVPETIEELIGELSRQMRERIHQTATNIAAAVSPQPPQAVNWTFPQIQRPALDKIYCEVPGTGGQKIAEIVDAPLPFGNDRFLMVAKVGDRFHVLSFLLDQTGAPGDIKIVAADNRPFSDHLEPGLDKPLFNNLLATIGVDSHLVRMPSGEILLSSSRGGKTDIFSIAVSDTGELTDWRVRMTQYSGLIKKIVPVGDECLIVHYEHQLVQLTKGSSGWFWPSDLNAVGTSVYDFDVSSDGRLLVVQQDLNGPEACLVSYKMSDSDPGENKKILISNTGALLTFLGTDQPLNIRATDDSRISVQPEGILLNVEIRELAEERQTILLHLDSNGAPASAENLGQFDGQSKDRLNADLQFDVASQRTATAERRILLSKSSPRKFLVLNSAQPEAVPVLHAGMILPSGEKILQLGTPQGMPGGGIVSLVELLDIRGDQRKGLVLFKTDPQQGLNFAKVICWSDDVPNISSYVPISDSEVLVKSGPAGSPSYRVLRMWPQGALSLEKIDFSQVKANISEFGIGEVSDILPIGDRRILIHQKDTLSNESRFIYASIDGDYKVLAPSIALEYGVGNWDSIADPVWGHDGRLYFRCAKNNEKLQVSARLDDASHSLVDFRVHYTVGTRLGYYSLNSLKAVLKDGRMVVRARYEDGADFRDAFLLISAESADKLQLHKVFIHSHAGFPGWIDEPFAHFITHPHSAVGLSSNDSELEIGIDTDRLDGYKLILRFAVPAAGDSSQSVVPPPPTPRIDLERIITKGDTQSPAQNSDWLSALETLLGGILNGVDWVKNKVVTAVGKGPARGLDWAHPSIHVSDPDKLYCEVPGAGGDRVEDIVDVPLALPNGRFLMVAKVGSIYRLLTFTLDSNNDPAGMKIVDTEAHTIFVGESSRMTSTPWGEVIFTNETRPLLITALQIGDDGEIKSADEISGPSMALPDASGRLINGTMLRIASLPNGNLIFLAEHNLERALILLTRNEAARRVQRVFTLMRVGTHVGQDRVMGIDDFDVTKEGHVIALTTLTQLSDSRNVKVLVAFGEVHEEENGLKNPTILVRDGALIQSDDVPNPAAVHFPPGNDHVSVQPEGTLIDLAGGDMALLRHDATHGTVVRHIVPSSNLGGRPMFGPSSSRDDSQGRRVAFAQIHGQPRKSLLVIEPPRIQPYLQPESVIPGLGTVTTVQNPQKMPGGEVVAWVEYRKASSGQSESSLVAFKFDSENRVVAYHVIAISRTIYDYTIVNDNEVIVGLSTPNADLVIYRRGVNSAWVPDGAFKVNLPPGAQIAGLQSIDPGNLIVLAWLDDKNLGPRHGFFHVSYLNDHADTPSLILDDISCFPDGKTLDKVDEWGVWGHDRRLYFEGRLDKSGPNLQLSVAIDAATKKGTDLRVHYGIGPGPACHLVRVLAATADGRLIAEGWRDEHHPSGNKIVFMRLLLTPDPDGKFDPNRNKAEVLVQFGDAFPGWAEGVVKNIGRVSLAPNDSELDIEISPTQRMGLARLSLQPGAREPSSVVTVPLGGSASTGGQRSKPLDVVLLKDHRSVVEAERDQVFEAMGKFKPDLMALGLPTDIDVVDQDTPSGAKLTSLILRVEDTDENRAKISELTKKHGLSCQFPPVQPSTMSQPPSRTDLRSSSVIELLKLIWLQAFVMLHTPSAPLDEKGKSLLAYLVEYWASVLNMESVLRQKSDGVRKNKNPPPGVGVALIPGLWRPVIEAVNGLALRNPELRFLPRLTAAVLGIFEELLLSGVFVYGGGLFFHSYFAWTTIASFALSNSLFGSLFVLAHSRTVYVLDENGFLVEREATGRSLAGIAVLTLTTRLIFMSAVSAGLDVGGMNLYLILSLVHGLIFNGLIQPAEGTARKPSSPRKRGSSRNIPLTNGLTLDPRFRGDDDHGPSDGFRVGPALSTVRTSAPLRTDISQGFRGATEMRYASAAKRTGRSQDPALFSEVLDLRKFHLTNNSEYARKIGDLMWAINRQTKGQNAGTIEAINELIHKDLVDFDDLNAIGYLTGLISLSRTAAPIAVSLLGSQLKAWGQKLGHGVAQQFPGKSLNFLTNLRSFLELTKPYVNGHDNRLHIVFSLLRDLAMSALPDHGSKKPRHIDLADALEFGIIQRVLESVDSKFTIAALKYLQVGMTGSLVLVDDIESHEIFTKDLNEKFERAALSFRPWDETYTKNWAWVESIGLAVVIGMIIVSGLPLGLGPNTLGTAIQNLIVALHGQALEIVSWVVIASYVPSIIWLALHAVIDAIYDSSTQIKPANTSERYFKRYQFYRGKRNYAGMVAGSVILHLASISAGLWLLTIVPVAPLPAFSLALTTYGAVHGAGHFVWNRAMPWRWALSLADRNADAAMEGKFFAAQAKANSTAFDSLSAVLVMLSRHGNQNGIPSSVGGILNQMKTAPVLDAMAGEDLTLIQSLVNDLGFPAENVFATDPEIQESRLTNQIRNNRLEGLPSEWTDKFGTIFVQHGFNPEIVERTVGSWELDVAKAAPELRRCLAEGGRLIICTGIRGLDDGGWMISGKFEKSSRTRGYLLREFGEPVFEKQGIYIFEKNAQRQRTYLAGAEWNRKFLHALRTEMSAEREVALSELLATPVRQMDLGRIGVDGVSIEGAEKLSEVFVDSLREGLEANGGVASTERLKHEQLPRLWTTFSRYLWSLLNHRPADCYAGPFKYLAQPADVHNKTNITSVFLDPNSEDDAKRQAEKILLETRAGRYTMGNIILNFVADDTMTQIIQSHIALFADNLHIEWMVTPRSGAATLTSLTSALVDTKKMKPEQMEKARFHFLAPDGKNIPAGFVNIPLNDLNKERFRFYVLVMKSLTLMTIQAEWDQMFNPADLPRLYERLMSQA